MRRLVHQDRSEDAAKIAFMLKLVNHYRRAIGQFVAGETKDFLADDFGGEKALRLVSQVVGIKHWFADGKQFLDLGKQGVGLRSFAGRHWHYSRELTDCRQFHHRSCQRGTILEQIDFVGHCDHRRFCRDQLKHGAIGGREARGVPHPKHDIHLFQRTTNATVEALVHLATVLGLETGSVDKNELCSRSSQDATQRQACGLRLA